MKIEHRPGQVFSSTAPFNWTTSTAKAAGLNEDQLETARQLSQENASDSLLILRDGRLVSETYWNDKTQADLQQTFSGTKSVFSLIVGRCIEHGYLSGLFSGLLRIIADSVVAPSGSKEGLLDER